MSSSSQKTNKQINKHKRRRKRKRKQKRNETQRNETKRNVTKRNEKKINEETNLLELIAVRTNGHLNGDHFKTPKEITSGFML